MAKRKSGSVNKSAAIRDYLKTHRGAKPLEIVAALKEQGVVVTAAFVSTVKATAKGKRGGKKAKRAAAASNGHAAISIADLLLAKQLAAKIGGVDKAKEAIDALAKLL